MKITVDAKKIGTAISKAQRFTCPPKLASNVSMGMVLLDVGDDEDGNPVIRVAAIDQYRLYTTIVPLIVGEKIPFNGRQYLICVPPSEISLLLESCKGDVVLDFGGIKPCQKETETDSADGAALSEVTSKLVVLPGAGRKYSFDTMDGRVFLESVEAFVKAVEEEDQVLLDIPFGSLKNSLKQVGYAVSSDATKIILNAIRLEHDGKGKLDMLSTDGHRLVVLSQSSSRSTSGKPINANIPLPALTDSLRSVANSENDTLCLQLSSKFGLIRSDEDAVTASYFRNIEGQYPNAKQLIPQSFAGVITFEANEALTAIKLLSKISGGSTILTSLNEGKSLIVLEMGKEAVANKGSEAISAHFQCTGQSPEKIAFNFKYLEEAIASANQTSTDGKVKLSVNSATSPVILSPATNSNDLVTQSQHLIMPIQIRS